jgi:hypothetical protein
MMQFLIPATIAVSLSALATEMDERVNETRNPRLPELRIFFPWELVVQPLQDVVSADFAQKNLSFV